MRGGEGREGRRGKCTGAGGGKVMDVGGCGRHVFERREGLGREEEEGGRKSLMLRGRRKSAGEINQGTLDHGFEGG